MSTVTPNCLVPARNSLMRSMLFIAAASMASAARALRTGLVSNSNSTIVDTMDHAKGFRAGMASLLDVVGVRFVRVRHVGRRLSYRVVSVAHLDGHFGCVGESRDLASQPMVSTTGMPRSMPEASTGRGARSSRLLWR